MSLLILSDNSYFLRMSSYLFMTKVSMSRYQYFVKIKKVFASVF